MTNDEKDTIIFIGKCLKNDPENISLTHIVFLLDKALEYVNTKSDLCDAEKEDIKSIRFLIKGL